MAEFISGIVTYCGGKKRLLSELYAQFDKFKSSDVFIDICGGSGIVTANYIAGRRIINDASTEFAVIYKALSDKKTAYKLARIIGSLKCNEKTYEKAKNYLETHKSYNLNAYSMEELTKAAAYSWFVHFFSRVGNNIDDVPKFTETKLIKWNKLVKDTICDYIAVFRGVEVWNMDMVDALEKVKGEIEGECVIYIDPPYLSDKNSNVKTNQNTYKNNGSSRNCGCSKEKHTEMLNAANSLPRKKYHIIISNYENECYDELLSTPGFNNWTKRFLKEIDIMCGNGSKDSHRKKAREFIYTN